MSGPLWQATLAYTAGFYTRKDPVSATRSPYGCPLASYHAGGDAHANRESDGRPLKLCRLVSFFIIYPYRFVGRACAQGEAQETLRTVRATFWDPRFGRW